MRFKFLFFVFCFLIFDASIASALQTYPVRMLPAEVFVDEDHLINFYVRPASSMDSAKSLTLVERKRPRSDVSVWKWLKGEEKKYYFWPLNDEGKEGDLVASDGTYSRRLSLKEKRPGKVVFFAVEGNEKELSLNPSVLDEIQEESILIVHARPTMQEILAGVWRNFWRFY